MAASPSRPPPPPLPRASLPRRRDSTSAAPSPHARQNVCSTPPPHRPCCGAAPFGSDDTDSPPSAHHQTLPLQQHAAGPPDRSTHTNLLILTDRIRLAALPAPAPSSYLPGLEPPRHCCPACHSLEPHFSPSTSLLRRKSVTGQGCDNLRAPPNLPDRLGPRSPTPCVSEF